MERVGKTPHRAGHGKNTLNGEYKATRNISAVRREVDETCYIMCYYAAYSGNSSPTFRGQPIWSVFKGQEIQEKVFFLDVLTLEDVTDRFSRNVGDELPSYAA